MALNFHRSNDCVDAAVDAQTALLNTGYLRIYSGTQPTTADDAAGAGTLLAELRMGATAFAASVDGVAAANAVTKDSSANATGAAAWFRALKSDGTSTVCDGTVAATGGTADCIINSVDIQSGTEVSVTAWTWTANKG
jgi:hypothetical protein